MSITKISYNKVKKHYNQVNSTYNYRREVNSWPLFDKIFQR